MSDEKNNVKKFSIQYSNVVCCHNGFSTAVYESI